MNIAFDYRYRDASNYKKWGRIVFINPDDMSCDDLAVAARAVLIDEEWFVATSARVPDLHFDTWDADDDHDWHEVAAFEKTGDEADDPLGRTALGFIADLQRGGKETLGHLKWRSPTVQHLISSLIDEGA